MTVRRIPDGFYEILMTAGRWSLHCDRFKRRGTLDAMDDISILLEI
jgi:hypothetical protein